MSYDLTHTGWRRYSKTGVTGTAGSDYVISAGNRIAAATIIAYAASGRPLFTLCVAGTQQTYRGVQIGFFANAINKTVPFRIYLVSRQNPSTIAHDKPKPGEDYEVQLLGTGSFVSRDTGAGTAASAIITNAEYPADEISFTLASDTVTPYGIGVYLQGVFGTNAKTFSPANNVPARLGISDLGNHDFLLIDFDPANGDVANAIIDAHI